MPRDLFGDVTRPSVSIGNRKWYTVPVSLLSHSMIVAMFLVLPIIAAPLMPQVFDDTEFDYLIDVLPPPPAPPARRPPAELKPVANPNAAPTVAPDRISPELPPVETSDREMVGVIGGDPDIDVILAPPPKPVPPPVPQGPVRVGGVIRQPVKTSGNDPVYSPIARAAGIQGIVILEATIGADGRVANVRVLRSIPLLDQAALEAVKTWEYTPTLLNGVPVPVIMTVTVTFTLSR
jgi:protein TonB